MDYKEREELKKEGWKLFSECKNPSGKANILLHYIIVAHYWRARQLIEEQSKPRSKLRKIRGQKYYPGYELDIDHYSENWLYSMRDNDFMKEGVWECLCEFYKPIQSQYMKDGNSIYEVN